VRIPRIRCDEALNSRLIAHDQIACAIQVGAKDENADHHTKSDSAFTAAFK